MKAALLHTLVLACTVSVALPRGWCCMLPAPPAEDQPAPATGCCCCPTPAPPAESDERPPPQRDDCPRHCCEREAAAFQTPEKYQPDLASLPAVVLTVDAPALPGSGGETEAAGPIPSSPLHVLHCLWLC